MFANRFTARCVGVNVGGDGEGRRGVKVVLQFVPLLGGNAVINFADNSVNLTWVLYLSVAAAVAAAAAVRGARAVRGAVAIAVAIVVVAVVRVVVVVVVAVV